MGSATSPDALNELMCISHANQARAILGVDFPLAQLPNATYRSQWIASQMQILQTHFLDGLNLDFESVVNSTSPSLKQDLNLLVQALETQLHSATPPYSFTFDVAWSPDCIDLRCYDYNFIADHTDAIFVMSYDLRSQVFPPAPCIAGPDAALSLVQQGVQDFLSLGISANQMILGVPWYGQDYSCINPPNTTYCPIAFVPFRGVNCSDAAADPWDYSQIMTFLADNPSVVPQWDAADSSPWFDHPQGSAYNQMWYDDTRSLRLKYTLAKTMGLRGVGCWNADSLDYGNSERARTQTAAMWNLFSVFSD